MAEYIEREAVLAGIEKRVKNPVIIHWLGGIISEQPAADVAPVVHGRWEERKRPTEHLMCSACCRKNFMRVKSTYCPNCGARMCDPPSKT